MTDAPRLDLESDGLWLSISEIAKMKGVSRQAVAKRVADLESSGKVSTKAGDAGTKLVNLAQYNLAIGETGDAFKEMAAETRAETAAADEAGGNSELRAHQARAAQYSADLKELDLKQRLGELVPVADVTAAIEVAGEALVRSIERMPTYAEAIAAAVAKDGANGARGVLKEMVREVRQSMAEAMRSLDAPATAAQATEAAPV